MSDVDYYLERMEGERIERYDLESLKRNMDVLNRKMDDLSNEKITQELERLALLAEDLLKKIRMQEVEALSREIKNRQTRFIDALRDQKGPLTPEKLQGLLKELEKLKELTAQVMEALGQMAAQLPDSFINSPELEGLNFQDLFKDLDEIQQKLMAGDLKGALEAAQRLLQNLSEMMAAMARAGSQSRMGSFDRLQSEMSRQTSELEKIVNEQKEILAGTEAVEEDLRRSLETEIESRLEGMMPPIQLTLEQLQGLLSSEQRDVVAEMKKLLQEEEIETLSGLADNLTAELTDNPAARKLADELVRALNGLTPPLNEAMTDDLREEFPELSTRQEALYEKTNGLGDMLETLSQLFPGMDSEIIHDIKTAAGAMGQASAKLKQTDAPGAIPPEEEAIRSLTRSQQSLQQMARQMAQQMAMQMQASRWGYPLAYDPRHGWYYGPWGSLPTLPQPEVKQRRERGYTGIDKEEFDPPAKDAYKAPQALREKVLEALKEDIPPQYQREVKRYFKGLTE
jgi:soluble cytochrome b562